MKKLLSIIGIIIAVALLALCYFLFLKKDPSTTEPVRYVVPLSSRPVPLDWPVQLALLLHGRSPLALKKGGYLLSPSQSAWEKAAVLRGEPVMKWVTVPEGLRKEEIAELLGNTLGWTEQMKTTWIKVDTSPDVDHREGVYFPDTYLIPISETTAEVAKRFLRNFDEKFGPLAKEAVSKNIKWTTAVNIASIIQREAAGKDDMALISGVIWNRLEEKMPLGIDATIQYARGNTGEGWWAKIKLEDKKIKSPYNTFTNKGLPPTPIANPGLNALTAAIRPATTTCLYYLHAPSKQIYCADTYEGHKENIEKYLK